MCWKPHFTMPESNCARWLELAFVSTPARHSPPGDSPQLNNTRSNILLGLEASLSIIGSASKHQPPDGISQNFP
jgi:hypothetical protein